MKKVIFQIVILLFIFLGYYFLNHNFSFAIPCLFNKITGLYCPGCGLTRMLFAVLEFKFKEAFFYNPFLFILLPFFTIYFLYSTYNYILGRKIKPLNKYITWILLGLTIIFGIVRNLPDFPFLRP